jgi:hypothetical protein
MVNEKGGGGMLKQWVDAVLFANYETFVDKASKMARGKGLSTGARIIHTERRAAWDAKNRYGLPEHLPLLDWLAVDFMEHGWSQRHLLRTILTSATYQQSSLATPAALDRDPRNQLLARGPRFRVDAEVVRDLALGIAGLLTHRSGGAPTYPPVPESVLEYNYVKPPYWKPS